MLGTTATKPKEKKQHHVSSSSTLSSLSTGFYLARIFLPFSPRTTRVCARVLSSSGVGYYVYWFYANEGSFNKFIIFSNFSFQTCLRLRSVMAIQWRNSISGRNSFEIALKSNLCLKGHFHKRDFKFPLTDDQKIILFDMVENIVDDKYVGPTTDSVPKPNYTGDIYIYQYKDEDAASLEKEGCTHIVFIAGFETTFKMGGFFDEYVCERDFIKYPSLMSLQKRPQVVYNEVQSALEKSPGLFKFVVHKKI